ncbi:MAG: FAD:protein FMN transferase [Gammaproteobacteria bacterium]
MSEWRVEPVNGEWHGRFTAMASPCEVLAQGADRATLERLTALACAEAHRIERKFSRYRDDNIVARIHAGGDAPVPIDEETFRLLQYADELYRLSGGLFDITSGVLRRAWKFDGSDRVPTPAQVAALLPLVGWPRVQWNRDGIRLEPGMQVDFGGIGKEYAVDRALALLAAEHAGPLLVNFGGDIAASAGTGSGATGHEWNIGIEHADGGQLAAVRLRAGGIATSGDARRFLLKDGVRYGHILDPRTGWPVPGAPRSVTVVARSCVEAGTLSTLAMLQGLAAEEFLAAQDLPHWVQR